MQVELNGSGFDAASAGSGAPVAFPARASSLPSDDCALDETVPIRRHSANAAPNRVARVTGVWCPDPLCIGVVFEHLLCRQSEPVVVSMPTC